MQPLFTCFTQNLNYAIGWMVIHSLWQATAIAIISGIVAIVVRKKSPQLRYWIHNAALLGVMIAAVVTFCMYYDFSKEIGQTIFIPEKLEAATNAPAFVANNQSSIDNSQSGAPLSMEGLRMYFNRNIYLIVTIWIMGVALFILKLLGGISYVYYLRSKLNFPADEYWLDMIEKLGKKAGVKRGIELVESALVRSPLVVGHLKPIILFPIGAINKLNTQEVEAILAHEIAHILRNDYIFNIIQSVIEALFYFHPAVWWISANIRNERENSCDDVAIALCGNSMTYAKALVSVQEIAHYRSPQMAMAFAGQHKNQLLFRVQRILKQPNNKTNVMEKLIATCLLLVMMVALSFGGNRWNNNIYAETNSIKDISSMIGGIETTANNPENLPFETFETKGYLKLKVNGVLDSFPVGKEVTDGNYNYADNIFQAKLTVKDHAVVSLNINGSDIKASEIKNHVGFINRIIMQSATPPQYKDDNQPNNLLNLNQQNNLDNQTVVLPNMNTIQMPIISESDGNMVVDNPNGSQTVISHPNNGDNVVQVVTTTEKDGSRSVTKTDNRGVTTTKTYDRNGKLVTTNRVGGEGAISIHQGNGKTYINGNTVTAYDNDGTKSVLSYDNDGGKVVKIYKNDDQLKHIIKLVNGQVLLDGRTASDNEIRSLGWERTNKGLQKIGGYNDIQPNTQNKSNNSFGSGSNEDKNERIDELKEEFNDLKEEIIECSCQTNIDFREKLIAKIDKVLNGLNKGLSENDAKIEFKNIQKTWEKGECDDKGDKGEKGSKNSGSNYYYGNGNNYAAAELARKDAARQREQVSINNNEKSTDDKALRSLFLNLKNAGFISLNKQCSVAFTNTQLNVNGKSLRDNAIFMKIKNDFEAQIPKSKYAISFTGIVTDIKNNEVSLDGSLNSSINRD